MVSNYARSLFWQDLWCEDILFRYKFDQFYVLFTVKQGTGKYLRIDGGWMFPWRRPVRGGIEIGHFMAMMVVLG